MSRRPCTNNDFKHPTSHWDHLTLKEQRTLTDVLTRDESLMTSLARHYRLPRRKYDDLIKDKPYFRNAWIEYMETHGIPMEKLIEKINNMLTATKDVVHWNYEGEKQVHKAPDNTARIAAAKMFLDRAAPIEKNVNIKHQSLKVNLNANVDTDTIVAKLKFIESRIREIDSLTTEEGADGGVSETLSTTPEQQAGGVGIEGSLYLQSGMSGIQGDVSQPALGTVSIRDIVEEKTEEVDSHAAGNIQEQLRNNRNDDMGDSQESEHKDLN